MRNKEAAEQRCASLMRYLRLREAGKGEKTIDIRFEQQVKVITERFASIPPFANGDVQMRTALKKILKDLVVKSQRISSDS
jgi:hypothetical protein